MSYLYQLFQFSIVACIAIANVINVSVLKFSIAIVFQLFSLIIVQDSYSMLKISCVVYFFYFFFLHHHFRSWTLVWNI